jgi:PAS domain S-box-containing protein
VACEKLRYTKEELLHMKPEDIYTPEYALSVKDRVSEITLKKQISFLSAHRCKNGKIIPVEIRSRLIDYRGTTAILSTARDITERKDAEKEKEKLYSQILQVQKMEALGLLAGGIAHDFNNILSGIIGYSELALYDMEQNNPARPFIEKVLKSSSRAKELARQILTFSRHDIEEKKDLKLASIIREALTFIRSSLPSTIEIKETISSKKSIKCDPTQIYQIVLNLCTNAGHAMKDKVGVLEVSLSDTELLSEDIPLYSDLKAGEYIKLSVKDTGHGMGKVVLERIFEPFFTTKERGEGTGMGLSVVHGIIKNHGGDITVYSEPGKGSIFNILLPVSDDMKTVKEEISGMVPAGKGRILFVDDERDIVELTEKVLIKLGYSVTATTSSMEALEIFKSHPAGFDLIITDQTMPELTGINLAGEIFKICRKMPVIICTGLMDALPHGKYDNFCIKEVMEKPVSMKKLAETIKKVIENKGEES